MFFLLFFIVQFYSHALYMVCFSTLISVVVINLTRLKNHRALPWIIKKHLDGKFGELLFLHHINDSEVCFNLNSFMNKRFDILLNGIFLKT